MNLRLKYAPRFSDILEMLLKCPKVVRNRNKTFSEYLKMFGIDNPEIGLMFQFFPHVRAAQRQIAALLTVGGDVFLREKPAARTDGSSNCPKDGKRYRELGGQMLLKSEVEKIIVDGKGVRGIRLKDGSIIRSRNIISTIDINSPWKTWWVWI